MGVRFGFTQVLGIALVLESYIHTHFCCDGFCGTRCFMCITKLIV